MATELQRAFGKSAIRRLFAAAVMQNEGIQIKGYKRTMNAVFTEALEAYTEPQIKYFLYSALQCYDLPEKERAEALKLLRMAETTLTEEQRERMAAALWE